MSVGSDFSGKKDLAGAVDIKIVSRDEHPTVAGTASTYVYLLLFIEIAKCMPRVVLLNRNNSATTAVIAKTITRLKFKMNGKYTEVLPFGRLEQYVSKRIWIATCKGNSMVSQQ